MVTKDEFMEYEKCRQSGVTNMFDVRMVEFITGLDRAKIIEVMKSYGELRDKYMGGEKHDQAAKTA